MLSSHSQQAEKVHVSPELQDTVTLLWLTVVINFILPCCNSSLISPHFSAAISSRLSNDKIPPVLPPGRCFLSWLKD